MHTEEFTQPRLIVDLDAIKKNYAELQRVAPNKEICPVVKSNAYGLGAVEVVRALMECGCRNFYVSTPKEGQELREHFADIQINVLNGPSHGNVHVFDTYRLTPVINNLDQFHAWEKACNMGVQTGCILNLETGFNRLGIKQSDWQYLTPKRLKRARVSLIMSHLSCAGEGNVTDPNVVQQNARQFAAYRKALRFFSGIPSSLALDAHMVNFGKLPISQIRSGAALYGINVFPNDLNLAPAFSIEAPLLQVEGIVKDDAVGYGATYHAGKDTRIAVLGIGYGNGVPRSLSNKGKVFFSDGSRLYLAPIVGRISMGLLNCDVSQVPDHVLARGKAALLTQDYTINEMCIDADCLDSEIMCHFSSMELAYNGGKQRQLERQQCPRLIKKNDQRSR